MTGYSRRGGTYEQKRAYNVSRSPVTCFGK